MIKGAHAMLYSSKAEELRAFIRDKLGFTFTDVGGGWLIFDLPEAELGCHPDDCSKEVPSGTHEISFYCDDIQQTVKELKARGVEFTDEIREIDYGARTFFRVPGGFVMQLYQPHYEKNRK